ncbi:MAG: ribosome-associated translation inhibitor RaiA [Proteobacteria bacterium]|nr:ribosome-associated translation inhibitor RaiA [Pseudomonadota bacterium]
MQQPLKITFRDIDHSAAVEDRIREKINKLDHVYNRITSCQVVVEQVQKHQHQGKLHNVTIFMNVPGKYLIASHHPQENLYLAIQQATDSLREQLDEYRRRLYGDTKNHGERLLGEIARLMEDEGYGFIVDQEKNEYYFNLSHLMDVKFHQLQVGEKVKFLPAVGNEGLQARRITIAKRSTF